MRGTWGLAAVAALTLAGCNPDPRTMPPVPDVEGLAADLDTYYFGGEAERSADDLLQEQPFANGALALLWREGGATRTASLVPCRGGGVCAGDPSGPAGTLVRAPSYLVVTGLMGRVFWLHPGGGGWVEQGGRLAPLAWDARAGGTGPGTAPAIETPAPHG